MAGEIVKTDGVQYWIATDGSKVLHYGETIAGLVTTSGQRTFTTATSESDLLDGLKQYIAMIPEIPPSGEPVTAREVYKRDGELYMVRADYVVDESDPTTRDDIYIRPTLTKLVRWVAGEKVERGTVRNYMAVDYKAVEPHITALGLEPVSTPKLWSAVVVERL